MYSNRTKNALGTIITQKLYLNDIYVTYNHKVDL